MKRAYKFLEDAEKEILALMEKEITDMKPHELDMLVGLCDLHKGVCEFVELVEKRPGMDRDGATHDDKSGWDSK